MATKQPRLNVVIEPAVYNAIHRLSKREGLSMSLVARDLLHEALLLYEDTFWAKEAEAREKTFLRKRAVSHGEIWKS